MNRYGTSGRQRQVYPARRFAVDERQLTAHGDTGVERLSGHADGIPQLQGPGLQPDRLRERCDGRPRFHDHDIHAAAAEFYRDTQPHRARAGDQNRRVQHRNTFHHFAFRGVGRPKGHLLVSYALADRRDASLTYIRTGPSG